MSLNFQTTIPSSLLINSVISCLTKQCQTQQLSIQALTQGTSVIIIAGNLSSLSD